MNQEQSPYRDFERAYQDLNIQDNGAPITRPTAQDRGVPMKPASRPGPYGDQNGGMPTYKTPPQFSERDLGRAGPMPQKIPTFMCAVDPSLQGNQQMSQSQPYQKPSGARYSPPKATTTTNSNVYSQDFPPPPPPLGDSFPPPPPPMPASMTPVGSSSGTYSYNDVAPQPQHAQAQGEIIVQNNMKPSAYVQQLQQQQQQQQQPQQKRDYNDPRYKSMPPQQQQQQQSPTNSSSYPDGAPSRIMYGGAGGGSQGYAQSRPMGGGGGGGDGVPPPPVASKPFKSPTPYRPPGSVEPSPAAAAPRSVGRAQEPKPYHLSPTMDSSRGYPGGQPGGGGGQAVGQEDEVNALTNLLLQNMEATKDPDFFGMCAKCGHPIRGDTTGCKALDQMFHIECFSCVLCGEGLKGHPFYAMEGKPYCEPCYMNLLEKCSVCSKPITDRILRATGKPYHPACFTCVVCGKSLDGVPFTVDATNQIHCIEDFHKKFAPRCCVCNMPIMPKPGEEETVRIVALDRSFHTQCYKCEDCGMVLSSESEGRGCYPLDDHILCKGCNAKRINAITRSMTTEL